MFVCFYMDVSIHFHDPIKWASNVWCSSLLYCQCVRVCHLVHFHYQCNVNMITSSYTVFVSLWHHGLKLQGLFESWYLCCCFKLQSVLCPHPPWYHSLSCHSTKWFWFELRIIFCYPAQPSGLLCAVDDVSTSIKESMNITEALPDKVALEKLYGAPGCRVNYQQFASSLIILLSSQTLFHLSLFADNFLLLSL